MFSAKVGAGCDIIRKTIAALEIPTVAGSVIVDVATYDAFPALSVMEDTYAPM